MFSGCDGIKERIGLWFAFSPELFSMTSIKLSNNNYAQQAKSIDVFLFGKKKKSLGYKYIKQRKAYI